MISYIFRIFWALFLGFTLVSSFQCTWNAEHGRIKNGLFWKNNTVVFLDPVLFPSCIAAYIGSCILLQRGEKCSGYLISLFLDLFFFVTVYFSVLYFLLPALRMRYTARTCATLWLIPVFLFYQPWIIYSSFGLPAKKVFYIPEAAVRVVPFVWLMGATVLFLIQLVSHLHFCSCLKRHSRSVEDAGLLELWTKVKRDLDFSDLLCPVKLCYCSYIRTPLSVGMFRKNRITYLPERVFSEEEAELIFFHELHHIQRQDTHTKFFLRFCHALGWLHPLVYLAVRKAEDDLELSCDEIVLQNADEAEKKKYAELLLSIAGDSRGYTTCLSAGAKALRYRLKATLGGSERKTGLWLLFSAVAISSLCVGNFALSTDRGTIVEVTGLESTEIWSAGMRINGREITVRDVETLSRCLGQLEVERFVTVYHEDKNKDTDVISGVFSDSDRRFLLTPDCLTLYKSEKGKLVSEKYYVRTPFYPEQLREEMED